MPQAFEGGADAWGKLDDAGKTAAITEATQKATAESRARVELFTRAEGKDAKLEAWGKLGKDEQIAAWKDMPAEQKKALGLETDPARPTYTDFKLPEGMTLDAEAIKGATELFADSGLSQEQAQKFIDMATQRELAAANRNVQAFVDLQTKWQGEVMADPEIGGSQWDASKASVDKLFDRLNIPGLKDDMNLTGAGNNPRIVKAFVRLSRMVSEDRTLNGQPGPSAAKPTPAAVIYSGEPAP